MYVRYFAPEIQKWQRKIVGVFSGSNKDTIKSTEVTFIIFFFLINFFYLEILLNVIFSEL